MRRRWLWFQWDAFGMAIRFLTRVPLSSRAEAETGGRARLALAHCVVYFPLVGTLVGTLTAGIMILLAAGLPAELAVVACLGFEAMLTGAFHEDGFADTCDALGGGWTREHVLEILKDSRLGTYGVLGLGLAVAARWLAMAALVREDVWAAGAMVIGAATIGRWSILWLMAAVPPVADRATGARAVGGRLGSRKLALGSMAAVVGLSPWFWWDCWGVAVALAVSAGVIAAYRWQVLRRVGGSTGDLLGAGCYLTQLASLIVAAWRLA